MNRTRSLRWLLVGIGVCLVISSAILLINSGSVVVSGVLFDADSASDLKIGTDQKQIIKNIEVEKSQNPVRINVESLVDSGANLDHNTSSYQIISERKTTSSGVYLQNANDQSATIVISESAIPRSGLFDLHIKNIDTTNVTNYNRDGDERSNTMSYTIKQGKGRKSVYFNISMSQRIQFDNNTYNQSSRSISYNYTSSDELTSNLSVTVWKQSEDGGIGQRVATTKVTRGNVSPIGSNLEGKADLVIGVHSPRSIHGIDAIYAMDTTTINIPIPTRLVNKPIYFSESQRSGKHNHTILFEFNTNISEKQGQININFSDKSGSRIQLNHHTQKYDLNGKFLYVYPSLSPGSPNVTKQHIINSIYLNNIKSNTSNIKIERKYVSPIRASIINSDNDKYTVNRGSNIGFVQNISTQYNISKSSGTVLRNIETTDSNNIYTFSTDKFEPGEYLLTSDSGNWNASIVVTEPTIDINTTTTAEDSEIPVRIGQDGAERTIALTVVGPGSQQKYREEMVLNRSSDISRSIPTSQPGNYSINIFDPNTGVNFSKDVDVIESRNPTISINTSKRLFSGGRVDLTLDSTYNRSSISLLSQSNASKTLKLSTTDTGPTPVAINTYASPDSASEFVTTGSGASVESVTGNLSSISPGTYNLTLRSKHGTAVADDSATVTVEPRSTTDLTAYTARETVRPALENASAVRDAIADGTLTESTTATANDTVVYAANATGLTGLVSVANASLERGADLDRLDGLSFGVTPADADGAAAENGTLGPTPNGSAVYLDRGGLFVVADGETAFGTETPPAADETFDVAFRVDDDRLRRDGDGDDRVTTRLTYRAADAADESPSDRGGTQSEQASTSGSEPSGTGGSSRTGASAGPDPASDAVASSGSVASGGSSGPAGSDGSAVSAGSNGSGSRSGSAEESGSRGSNRPAGGESAAAGGSPGTDESAGSGSSGAPGRSAGTADGPSEDHSGSPPESLGSDGDRATRPPGVGIAAGPGASQVPPSARPPGLSDVGSADVGDENPSRSESASDDADPAGDGTTGTGAAAAEPTESPMSTEAEDQPGDETAASDLGYDDAPIRSTAYDLPGFGPVGSLAAVACAALLARSRASNR